MEAFKDFYNKPILGIDEIVDVEGLGKVKAKVDSGNEAYNVIHGVDISQEGENVSFTTIGGKRMTAPRDGEIKIHIGSGVKEDRPTVKLNIKIGDKAYKGVTFSVADRSENQDPILIGEPFLKKLNAVIDVNKEIK